mmetsp:Transcript_23245/g.34440  ORF Transcript_23245/g.34440 Transcript_23245/m.34440 type:complete len:139 (-) Transcript_23245:209-625(-)
MIGVTGRDTINSHTWVRTLMQPTIQSSAKIVHSPEELFDYTKESPKKPFFFLLVGNRRWSLGGLQTRQLHGHGPYFYRGRHPNGGREGSHDCRSHSSDGLSRPSSTKCNSCAALLPTFVDSLESVFGPVLLTSPIGQQ